VCVSGVLTLFFGFSWRQFPWGFSPHGGTGEALEPRPAQCVCMCVFVSVSGPWADSCLGVSPTMDCYSTGRIHSQQIRKNYEVNRKHTQTHIHKHQHTHTQTLNLTNSSPSGYCSVSPLSLYNPPSVNSTQPGGTKGEVTSAGL
jgi:hypothetical protein